MRLVRARREDYLFQMTGREKGLFLEVLRQFPLIPPTHHRLSRRAPAHEQAENERLLLQAMAASKQEQKARVGKLVSSRDRFVAHGPSWRIAFTREEIEWLLQVLNDVRVGSWLRLGCPDPDQGRGPPVTEANAPYLFFLELSGHFQVALLEALEQSTDAA